MNDEAFPARGQGKDAEEAATRVGGTGAMPTSILDGRYRVERVVGEGAFGRVYLAFDTRLRRNVAIKELLAARDKTDQATYDRYLDRFQREARAAGVAQHQNIVTVYELYVDASENYYLVMEYIDGTSLRDLLAQVGSLPVDRVVAVALEVARALEAVHEQDIVHRDLKPANIMLTRRGMAKLADFGIAQVGHESMRTQIASGHPGTPMYMSPEQASGYGYIDGRSDLYSLGLVIYEMLVGAPFARKRQPLVGVRPDLPAALVAIVNRLIERDTDARYQSASDLIDDLQRLSIAPAHPILADPPTARDGDETRIGTPPGLAPPALGVPSSYGGPASQSAPGVPTPPIADAATRIGQQLPVDTAPSADDGATRVSISPPTPPAVPGMAVVPPQTSSPPPVYARVPSPSVSPAKSKRGLLIGIGGIAAILIIGGVIAGVITNRGAGATATPLVQTATWSDRESRIRLQYPGGWTLSGPNVIEPNAAVFLTTPGIGISVTILDPVGPLDDTIQQARNERTTFSQPTVPGNTLRPDTCTPTADARVGGQAARYLECVSASGTLTIGNWVVDNGGKRFRIQANDLSKHRPEIERVINSVTFTTPTGRGAPAASVAAAQMTTWTDAGGKIALKYPANWTTKSSGAANTLLDLNSPTGERFVVDVYDQTDTLAEAIQADRDAHAKDTSVTYTDGTVTDTQVGGEAAKTMSFSYLFKNNPGGVPAPGVVWIVNHGGKTYRLYVQNMRPDRTAIDAIVASVTFPK